MRNFLVAATNYSGQGGSATTCGIPNGPATAAVINFVAVSPAGAGDLRATPFGTAIPLAAIINYAAVPGLNIANGLAVTICDPATTTCSFDLTIQADVSVTDLVADVQGYFRKVRKEQVKSLSVLGTGSQSSAATTCTNAGGLSTTITAPVAGKVVVNTVTSTYIPHTAGVSNEVDFYWGTSPTACTTSGTFLAIPSTLPAGGYFFPVGATQMFSVAGGSTTTFYFNSIKAGADTVTVSAASYAAMTATFIPD